MHVLFPVKRLAFSDPLLSHRRRLFRWFSLGVVASLLLLSLFILGNSLRVSKVAVFVPQLSTVAANSSLASRPFLPFNNTSHSSSSGSSTSNTSKSDEYKSSVKVIKEGSVVVVDGNGANHVLEETKSVRGLQNYSFSTYLLPESNKGKHEGDLVGENSLRNVTVTHNEKMQVGLHEECDIFYGKWVKDGSKPYYPLGSCPHIDRDFNCHQNGRPDGEYVKWRWQPYGCKIPR